ncbi:DUF5655 domain-containing protein [Microlunatus elymi]|uniref:DUF5655 domain-containing protein n=1 Tax=Microlunatus elymi TaxID=2596828 RepID=UPI001AF00EFF|nr:DUF5655 domain-containing protein [Microlunatus elymi]
MTERVWSVDDHLDGRTEGVRELYRRLIDMVEACGPFSYAVSKSAITLKGTRRGFAGAVPKQDRLDGYLDLQRRVDDPRILSSSPYTKRLFVHYFRLTEPDQLDDSFAELIAEAYAVGQGEHLSSGLG